MTDPIPGIDLVLLDIGGTLVAEAPPGTAVAALVVEPLAGVLELLPELARAHRLGAVTDTAVMTAADVRALLEPSGIAALLETIVTSHDIGAAKPDPRGILAACRTLDCAVGRTLYIGDRDVDRDAAAAAGCAFASVEHGFRTAIDAVRHAAAPDQETPTT